VATPAPEAVPETPSSAGGTLDVGGLIPAPAVPPLGAFPDVGLLGLNGLVAESQIGVGNDVTVSTSSVTARVTDLRSPVTAMVARYSGNPSGAPLSAVSFSDVRVVGASDDAVAKVVFHLPEGMSSAQRPMYFDGIQWRDVGGELITRPTEGTITVNLNSASQPRVTELGGTFFAVVPRQPGALLGPTVEPKQVNAGPVPGLPSDGFPWLAVLLGLTPVAAVVVASLRAWRTRAAPVPVRRR
jgi:hypothetical protein